MEQLEPRNLLAGDPPMTEFQAINDSTLTDESGDTSDWIEIRNSDPESTDLAGGRVFDGWSERFVSVEISSWLDDC